MRRAAAWGVHLFTASSAPAGVLAILAAVHGEARVALLWMAFTIAVDGIDGTLARALDVKRVLPFIDGARLDDIVDYFTYVVVPAVFMLQFGLFPPAVAVPVALAPVLASALGFARTDAKTTDHFFTGFPSYWNIVAFYLYALGWPPAANAAVVLVLAALVFVPIRYVYPSRTVHWRGLTITLGILWAGLVLASLATAQPSRVLAVLSLLFPVYYLGLSFYLHRQRAS